MNDLKVSNYLIHNKIENDHNNNNIEVTELNHNDVQVDNINEDNNDNDIKFKIVPHICTKFINIDDETCILNMNKKLFNKINLSINSCLNKND